MTLVSNDPSFWPQIIFNRVGSYFVVASSVAIVYDWALNFGQEIELIWGQRWSLVTFLYLGLRYIGLIYAVENALASTPTVSLTDTGCVILKQFLSWFNFTTEIGRDISIAQWWTVFVADIILGAIIITRLYAMYEGSKKMLIFLIGTFLAVTITCLVMNMVGSHPFIGDEFVLSGNYICTIWENHPQLIHWTRVIGTVWETLTLCLAVWIAIKHFRGLKRLGVSTGSTIGDCFAMLIKSQVLYFTAFAAVSCFDLIYFSSNLSVSTSVGAQICFGIIVFVPPVQVFVLGPHLILSIREYHAELVDNSEAGTNLTTIWFQERVHVSAGSGV